MPIKQQKVKRKSGEKKQFLILDLSLKLAAVVQNSFFVNFFSNL